MLLASTLLASGEPDPGTPSGHYDNYHLGAARKGIIVMPDAKGKTIQLLFVAGRPAPASIKVTDEQGKLVLVQEAMLEQGKNKISLQNFMQLPEGNYTIRLQSANKSYSSAFLFWK